MDPPSLDRRPCLDKRHLQLPIVHRHGKLGELVDDILRRAEKNPPIRLGEHARVIVGITGSDDLKSQLVESLHRLTFLVRHAEMVGLNSPVCGNSETMTKERRVPELSHQRAGELVKSIGQNDNLELGLDPFEEFQSPFERSEAVDDLLHILDFQSVLIKNTETLRHQDIVIGNVPRRREEGVDSGFLRHIDPDFRNKDAFKIQAGYFHKLMQGWFSTTFSPVPG